MLLQEEKFKIQIHLKILLKQFVRFIDRTIYWEAKFNFIL